MPLNGDTGPKGGIQRLTFLAQTYEPTFIIYRNVNILCRLGQDSKNHAIVVGLH